MNYRSWEDMQVQYRLASSDRQTFDLLLSSIHVHLIHKVGIQSVRPWWQDWKWYPATPFANYKPNMGYRWLSPHLPMVVTLNQRWHLQSSLSQWRKRFDTIWSAITEPKIAHFAWCLAFQGLPLGPRLKHIGVPDPRCPFCGQPESFLHIFWFCKRAQNYWHWIYDFFKPFWPEPFSWHMILLGDSPRIPRKFSQIWHTYRMEILFSLWKDRNVVLFTHSFLDVNIAMYTKACICNNVILQIQVQANKVALEVAHLQELLNHWGNAPCTIARLPPDASADASSSRGRRSRRQSSGRRSHTPRSQGPRPRSPSGGHGGWRRRSASPPRGGSGGSPAPPPGRASGWSPTPPPGRGHSGKFPRLALTISPLRPDKEDAETAPAATDAAAEGWTVPSPPFNPTDAWGFNDKDDPPPSAGTALAA